MRLQSKLTRCPWEHQIPARPGSVARATAEELARISYYALILSVPCRGGII